MSRSASWASPLGGPDRDKKSLPAGFDFEQCHDDEDDDGGAIISAQDAPHRQCISKTTGSRLSPRLDRGREFSGPNAADSREKRQLNPNPNEIAAPPKSVIGSSSVLEARKDQPIALHVTTAFGGPERAEFLKHSVLPKQTAALAVATAAAHAATHAADIAVDAVEDCLAARMRFEHALKAKTLAQREVDAELRATLRGAISHTLHRKSLEDGLKCLDSVIKETAAHVSQLKAYPASLFPRPDEPPLLDKCPLPRKKAGAAMENATRRAIATPDLARLVGENQVLAAAAQSMLKSVSTAGWEPEIGSSTRIALPTGISDALYQSPMDSPLWDVNKARHTAIVPALRTFLQKQTNELCSFWTDQVTDYDGAEARWSKGLSTREQQVKTTYPKARRHRPSVANQATLDGSTALHSDEKMMSASSQGGTCPSLFSLDSSRATAVSRVSVTSRYAPTPIDGDETGGTGAPTRARKALRDETEHERLVSEVLASSAKEARFARGAVDESELPIPLPVLVLAQEDSQVHLSPLSCRAVLDAWGEETRFSRSWQWTDLERCIFLDKFLQYPKNFGKIAAFLARKRARDCARLYYDSKYTIDYKALLREHQQRRRGVRICWDITAKAVSSFGGEIEYDAQRHLVWFRLPVDDFSTMTTSKHLPQDEPPKSNLKRIDATCGNSTLSQNASSGSTASSPFSTSCGSVKDSRGSKASITSRGKLARQSIQRKTRPPTKGPKAIPAVLMGSHDSSTRIANSASSFREKRAGVEKNAPLPVQKRLRPPQPHETAPSSPCPSQHEQSTSHVTAMHLQKQYLPPAGPPFTNMFSLVHVDGGYNYLSHPVGLSPALSTSTSPIDSLSRRADAEQLHKRENQKESEHQDMIIQQSQPLHQMRRGHEERECREGMQNDPTSLLPGLRSYSGHTAHPINEGGRLAYDRLRQMAPILSSFPGSQMPSGHCDEGHQFTCPQAHQFYNRAPCINSHDPAKQAAITGSADLHSPGGQSASMCEANSQPRGTSRCGTSVTLLHPYLRPGASNEFLGSPPAIHHTTLDALVRRSEYCQSDPLTVGVDGQGVGLLPPAPEPHHAAATVPSTLRVAACSTEHIPNPVTSVSDDNLPSSMNDGGPVHEWSPHEKSLFLRHLASHGTNWGCLARLIPTKTEGQIKNYYLNYKIPLEAEDILPSPIDGPDRCTQYTKLSSAIHPFESKPQDSDTLPAATTCTSSSQSIQEPGMAARTSIAITAQKCNLDHLQIPPHQFAQVQVPQLQHNPMSRLQELHGFVDARGSATSAAFYQHVSNLESSSHAITEGTSLRRLEAPGLFPSRQAQLWQSNYFTPGQHHINAPPGQQTWPQRAQNLSPHTVSTSSAEFSDTNLVSSSSQLSSSIASAPSGHLQNSRPKPVVKQHVCHLPEYEMQHCLHGPAPVPCPSIDVASDSTQYSPSQTPAAKNGSLNAAECTQ